MSLPGAGRYAGSVFAANYAAFGVIMILFLVFEPQGLVGIWRRIAQGRRANSRQPSGVRE